MGLAPALHASLSRVSQATLIDISLHKFKFKLVNDSMNAFCIDFRHSYLQITLEISNHFSDVSIDIACSLHVTDLRNNNACMLYALEILRIHTTVSGDHYNNVIMSAMASQITNLTIAYSTVYSSTDQRKHQSYASLAFVRIIHKGPVTRKMFPFDDVIMRVGWRKL